MNAVTKTPTVINLIEDRIASIAAVLPTTIKPERFVAAFKTSAMNNPDIMRADQRSVVLSVMQSATDGLMPDGRDAAIVVRGGKAQYQRMVTGLLKLLFRTGQVSTVDVQVVREGDDFDYGMGDEPFIHHKPTLKIAGELVAVYSVVTMKDGSKSRCLMGAEEVLRLQRMSPQGWDRNAQKPRGIWAQHPAEMWKKTCLHRHTKILSLEGMPTPLSDDEVAQVDDAAWNEPEDYTSQPDSGPVERLQPPNDPADQDETDIGPAPSAEEPTSRFETVVQPSEAEQKEFEFWFARLKEFKETVNAEETVEGVEDRYNEWLDTVAREVPEDVATEIGKMISKRVTNIRKAIEDKLAYERTKG
jgi:recombination protein RecT